MQETLSLNKSDNKNYSFIAKSILTLFAIVFFLTSCSFGSFAPRSVHGYEISVVTKKADSYDQKYLNKSSRYVFGKNETYVAYFEGKIDSAGDYSYRRKGRNKAQLVFSYSDTYGVNDYVMILTFVNEKAGYWEGSGYKDAVNAEKGTFTVLKGNFKK